MDTQYPYERYYSIKVEGVDILAVYKTKHYPIVFQNRVAQETGAHPLGNIIDIFRRQRVPAFTLLIPKTRAARSQNCSARHCSITVTVTLPSPENLI
jgi:hypothetical protein